MACKSGMHRAVAGAYLAARALEAYLANLHIMQEVGGLSNPQAGIMFWAGDRWGGCCPNLRLCAVADTRTETIAGTVPLHRLQALFASPTV